MVLTVRNIISETLYTHGDDIEFHIYSNLLITIIIILTIVDRDNDWVDETVYRTISLIIQYHIQLHNNTIMANASDS